MQRGHPVFDISDIGPRHTRDSFTGYTYIAFADVFRMLGLKRRIQMLI